MCGLILVVADAATMRARAMIRTDAEGGVGEDRCLNPACPRYDGHGGRSHHPAMVAATVFPSPPTNPWSGIPVVAACSGVADLQWWKRSSGRRLLVGTGWNEEHQVSEDEADLEPASPDDPTKWVVLKKDGLQPVSYTHLTLPTILLV